MSEGNGPFISTMNQRIAPNNPDLNALIDSLNELSRRLPLILLTDAPLLLCFTMIDLLPRFLELKPLENIFPNYSGGSSVSDAIRFIVDLYREVNKPCKRVQIYFVNSLSADSVRSMLMGHPFENDLFDRNLLGVIRQFLAPGLLLGNTPAQVFEAKDKVPIVYSDDYNIGLFGLEKLHPFDSHKYERVFNYLLEAKLFLKGQHHEPDMLSIEQLLSVHSANYLQKLDSSSSFIADIVEMPVGILPVSTLKSHILQPMLLQASGSVLCVELAMQHGFAFNLGGGFHHASASHGEGFCVYADISLCVQRLTERFPAIKRVLVIDLDAHQGNGYETDKRNECFDVDVYVLDMFNQTVFPNDINARFAIDSCVPFDSGIQTERYLQLLQDTLATLPHHFDFIIFNAGSDILTNDPLGCCCVSAAGIILRDEIVFGFARENKTPVVYLTSGGYQKATSRVVADSILNLNEKFDLFPAVRMEEADVKQKKVISKVKK